MHGLILGLFIGMFVTYAFLHPDSVKLILGKIVDQIKKLFGKK